MEIAIFIAVSVLILLVAALLLRSRQGDVSGLQAVLRQEFLGFQSTVHTEMDTARRSVEGAKDVISGHALQTVGQMKEMGQTVQKLIQQQEEAQRLGHSLKDLLQSPKLRGNYGEVVLEEMLDKVLPRGVWQRQYAIEGDEKVDCVVRLRETVVPIDAKFPRDDYGRYLSAESEDQKLLHWKAFEQAVKRQVLSIKKKYVKPEHGTTDFALMFIPSEAIYYETIAERNQWGETSSIWEFAQDNHVIPVGPNVFYAFLQVVILSIRSVEVVRNAKQLQEALSSLERSFGGFYKKYDDIGRAIERASSAYGVGRGHIDRFKRRLDGALQLEALEQPAMGVLADGRLEADEEAF